MDHLKRSHIRHYTLGKTPFRSDALKDRPTTCSETEQNWLSAFSMNTPEIHHLPMQIFFSKGFSTHNQIIYLRSLYRNYLYDHWIIMDPHYPLLNGLICAKSWDPYTDAYSEYPVSRRFFNWSRFSSLLSYPSVSSNPVVQNLSSSLSWQIKQ